MTRSTLGSGAPRRALTLGAALLLALAMRATPAAAQCTHQLWPQDEAAGGGIKLVLVGSTAFEDPGGWNLEVCFAALNQSAGALSVQIDLTATDDSDTSLDFPVHAARAERLIPGLALTPLTCSTLGSSQARMATASLPAGAVSDKCCFDFGSVAPNTCADLPGVPDIVSLGGFSFPVSDTAHVEILAGGSSVFDEPIDLNPAMLGISGPSCGLLGPELLGLVALASLGSRLRRRARRARAGVLVVATATLLPAAAAQAQTPVTFTVQNGTTLTGTLDAIGSASQPVTVIGTLQANLGILGEQVTSFDPTGGTLTFQPAGMWSVVFGPGQTPAGNDIVGVNLTATDIDAVPGGAERPATDAGGNTSEATLAGFELTVGGGSYAAAGTALDQTVSTVVDFAVTPITLVAGSGTARFEVKGGTTVELTLPVEFAMLPIAEPLPMPLRFAGEMILTAPLPPPAPTPVPGPGPSGLGLVALLLAGAGLALALRRR